MTIPDGIQHYFDECGRVGSAPTANAEKVRRIVHLVAALARKPMGELRILDMASGHGTYALEFGLQGARRVLGLDARTERMAVAESIAEKLEIPNVAFEKADVRSVSLATHGEWDVVLFLGILYHLDAPDCCQVLGRIAAMTDLLLIDTFIGGPQHAITYDGATYRGTRAREHADTDSAEVKRARVRSSIDNCLSFYWAPESLWRFLTTLGYNVVLEARAPLEPQKPTKRVTLAALRTPALPTRIYPWIAPGGGTP